MTTPGPTPDLRSWLSGIGLGAHVARFVENGIDWDVLGDLDDNDLKALGLSLGDRKRLVRAIAARTGAAAAAPPPSPAVASDAERRHVSVMFADLVGSTPLAEKLDPEEMRQVLHVFHRAAAAAIEAHDGHLATFLGDGILAYFDYPTAHEATDGIAARRALLDEYVDVTGALGSLVLLVEALHYQVPFSLELGDFATFGAALARFTRLTTETGQLELRRAVAAGGLAMQGILAGEFPAAEKHADAALAHASATHAELWQGVYGLQMFTIRREQGRLAEVAPLLRRFMDGGQSEATWRPGLMVIASDLGFAKEARNAFDRLAATGFDFPRDGKYLLTLSYLEETCTRLRDRERAAQLYDLLWPFRDLVIVVPSTTVCIGAVARHLGLLATNLERWDAAAAPFQSAFDLNSKLERHPASACSG